MRLTVLFCQPLRCLFAAFVEYRLRHEFQREPDADGQQQGAVEHAQQRDEIRNQINRTEGVSYLYLFVFKQVLREGHVRQHA